MCSQLTMRILCVSFSGYLILWMGSIAESASPQADPCKVLTTAEVEQVVGTFKGVPKADKEDDAAWCDYQFADGKDAMEVWVFPADAIDRAKKKAKKRPEKERMPKRPAHIKEEKPPCVNPVADYLPIEKIANDVERDFFMSAEDAKAYGIIDEIFEPRKAEEKNG